MPIFTCWQRLKKPSYYGHEHEIRKEKCPAFGTTCTKCLKKNNFQAVCKFKKKNVEKIELKKKDILLKVKINNFDLDMQMYTSSEVRLIPKNFWEHIGKPTLTTPPIWWVSYKNVRVLWRFVGVRR